MLSAIRRQLLSIQAFTHTFELISEDSYTGKVFYCTCYYDGKQVFGTWAISYGDTYASINQNGKVTINEGVVSEAIEITCTYGEDTVSKTITISYDNQITIEGQDTMTGTSGNVIARYNSTIVSPTWSITSGGAYASIDQTGAITITASGVITVQAVYSTYTATKNITLVYEAGTSSTTEVGDDGSVTTTTTTTSTDPETGAVTESSSSTTVNDDGSTSSTTTETTTNQDGSSETTSTTTNQDGTSSETQSTTSAPDPETGAVTSESTTTHYDENGDVSGSSENTTVENQDGSSTSQTNNYDANGDPTSTTNNEVDTSGNSSTQEIEYDSNGDPVVTGYEIDTSGGNGGKEIVDGVNTEYYAFDPTRGFILDIDFTIAFLQQPAGQNENHHNILTAKRATPSPWYGFQIRQTGTNKYIVLGTQFATGSNTNTTINPTAMVNNTAEYVLQITYDPTLPSNNFICKNMRTGSVIFTATNTFPDIPDLRYLKVCLGYAMDENGDPYRYSNVTIHNFSITKLTNVLPPSISCNGRYVTITTNETGADTYYRLNESGNFSLYTTQFAISDDTIVEAYSEINGLSSGTVSETCVFTGLKKPHIAFNGEIITITCETQNATIYYRLGQSGQYDLYNAPIQIFTDTVVETYSELAGDTSEVVMQNCIYNPTHDYSADYLTFKVRTAGTIGWQAYGTGYAKTIEYSKNNGEWTSITATKTTPATITVAVGDEVRFRGTNTTYAGSKANYSGFDGGNATFDIEGNIMSLVYGDNFQGQTALTGTYNFCSLFKQSKVLSAEHLILPSLTLTNYCYRALFSLSTLIKAPALPATTLATGCYWYMFEACPITEAPDLEAATLVNECYGYMFTQCTSLCYIRCLATAGFGTSQCLTGWVNKVASAGTFVKHPNASS